MKVYVSGGHYHAHIDNDEYFGLPESPLSAPLQNDSGLELGKRFYLSYDSRAISHEINFVPPESFWDELREVHVRLSGEEYEELGSKRYYVIRFGGSQSIDLHLEDDISGLI